MDLSKIKMVVTDMDGTLLNSNHEVSELFFELFKKMKDRSILFVAASGRQYKSIIDKLDPIKNDIIVIAENGGLVIKDGIELLATPLSNSYKNRILEALDSIPDCYPVLCSKTNAYVNGSSTEFIEKLREYYTDFEMLDDLKSFKGEILKIAIYHFKSSEEHIYPHVKHFESDLKVKISGEHWLDISSQHAHKGYALQKVMDRYHIKSNEVMVFGDYNNDLEMLALTDYSFAMENAHTNVKEVANHITKSNDAFGVEVVLEKLLSAMD